MNSIQCSVRIALLAALLYPSLFFAQQSLNGKITDESGQALSGATVLLLQRADSLLVKGQISSAEGRYAFENVEAGDYFLKTSMLGMEDQYVSDIKLTAAAEARSLPDLVLKPSAASLEAVEIVAKKPLFEQKVDRLVVNVSSSATNAGSNALQVLQRSPGIMVNRQTNLISMAGRSGVLVMINGKLNRMPPDAVLQVLEGIPADQIERIELIHTPPSSFDAEGNAGILNIVLKQSADAGLNGSYSLNGGYGKREKYGAGLNFNYRRNKLNLFGQYSYRFDHNPQVFTNYRGIQLGNDFVESDGFSKRSPDLGIQNARLGADFQLSSKTVIGAAGTFFDRYWDMDARNEIRHTTNQKNDSTVQMRTLEINHWSSWTGNVNLSHQFSEGQMLSADADYVYYHISNPSEYDINLQRAFDASESNSALEVRKENPISIYVAKVDYTRPFGKKGSLEAGLKGASSRFDNDVQVRARQNELWSVDSNLTSRFKLREDVAAAYASASFKLDGKTDAKLGLRYEYTSTALGAPGQPKLVDRKYGSLFPTVYLSRTINEQQSLTFSYSRRIARPGFTQLAPYLIFYDPNTVQSGNPALQPAFIQLLNLGFRYKSLNISTDYYHETPTIRDMPFIDYSRNTQVTRPVNLGENHMIFVSVSLPWQAATWWNMQNSLFAAWQRYDATIENRDISVPSGFIGINCSQSFTLPRKFSIDLSGNIVTDNYYGLIKYKMFGFMAVGVQKKLGSKWGELTFNVTDLFNSANYYGYLNQPELNLRVNTSYQQAERTFMLTWSNKFGNSKLKAARERQRGAADELNRLGG